MTSNVTAKRGQKRKVPGDGVDDTDINNIVSLVLSQENQKPEVAPTKK